MGKQLDSLHDRQTFMFGDNYVFRGTYGGNLSIVVDAPENVKVQVNWRDIPDKWRKIAVDALVAAGVPRRYTVKLHLAIFGDRRVDGRTSVSSFAGYGQTPLEAAKEAYASALSKVDRLVADAEKQVRNAKRTEANARRGLTRLKAEIELLEAIED